MYLTKIELTNFQSHKSTTINLVGGFVCIAGKTRSGKSSVLRALNFLFNDIWSDSFIRTGEKNVTVSVTLDNGIKVTRQKGNGLNKITITYPDNTVKEFTNFGIQAPVEVKNILGVFPLRIDSDYTENVNIHMQDDPHFLITKSAPVKTKFINRLTRLHIIDSVNRSLTKELQDMNKQLEESQQAIIQAKAKVQEYSSVESKLELFKELQGTYKKVTKVIENLNLKYDKLFIMATKAAEYLRIKVIYEKRKRIINKISGTQGIMKRYGRVQALLLVYAKYEHLNRVLTKRTELVELYKKLDEDIVKFEKLQYMEQKLQELKQMQQKLEEQQIQIQVAKEHTKICPTCKRPLWSDNEQVHIHN
jgi:exonuclease SbcC